MILAGAVIGTRAAVTGAVLPRTTRQFGSAYAHIKNPPLNGAVT